MKPTLALANRLTEFGLSQSLVFMGGRLQDGTVGGFRRWKTEHQATGSRWAQLPVYTVVQTLHKRVRNDFRRLSNCDRRVGSKQVARTRRRLGHTELLPHVNVPNDLRLLVPCMNGAAAVVSLLTIVLSVLRLTMVKVEAVVYAAIIEGYRKIALSQFRRENTRP